MGWKSLQINSLLRTVHLKAKAKPVLAPGATDAEAHTRSKPGDANTLLGGAPIPPDTSLNASAAALAGRQAAAKQRKKAMSGSTRSTLLTGQANNPQASLAPKSLLGY
jgi:hypothetical protein